MTLFDSACHGAALNIVEIMIIIQAVKVPEEILQAFQTKAYHTSFSLFILLKNALLPSQVNSKPTINAVPFTPILGIFRRILQIYQNQGTFSHDVYAL